jgi:hypothetical protein
MDTKPFQRLHHGAAECAKIHVVGRKAARQGTSFSVAGATLLSKRVRKMPAKWIDLSIFLIDLVVHGKDNDV